MAKSIERSCKVCNKTFRVFVAWLRGGNGGIFCSLACQRIGRRKKPPVMVDCVCGYCGMLFSRRKSQIRGETFCNIQCMTKKKGHERSGVKHPNWKGGTSERDQSFKVWSKEVKKRDGKKCVECGSIDKVQAHHKKDWSGHPDTRYLLENGETLCSVCHAKRHPKLANLINHELALTGEYKKCEGCGKDYYVRPWKLKHTRWCSRKCRRKMERKVCVGCGVEYEAKRYQLMASNKWCSKKCYQLTRTKKIWQNNGSLVPFSAQEV